MQGRSISLQARRRTRRRYAVLLFVLVAAAAGWAALWKYAAARAADESAKWRAHEAAAGRIFECGDEKIAGFPFRIEVTCTRAHAQFRDFQPALDIALPKVLTAAQIYQPNLLISEFDGPMRGGPAGRPAEFEATWSLGQASVSGILSTPDRVSLVFDAPKAVRFSGGGTEQIFAARHLELHGRPSQGAGKPGIEAGIRLEQAVFPLWRATASQPIDGVIDTVLHGVTDFTPKPLPVRLRELQSTGGGIEIKQARLVQGDVLAVGEGALSFNAAGRLNGQLRVTIAGLDALLERIGAKQMIQTSPAVDKLAGALDRLAPGLGSMARQQVSENIGTGINAIGEQATLEGRRAVSLPLRFDDGAVSLGPIPLGRIQ